MIELPKNVYEALRDGAVRYDGIGGGQFNDYKHVPLCKAGILNAVDRDYNRAAADLGLTSTVNDRIVATINWRKGMQVYRFARVSFDEYVTEGHIVCAEL